MSKVYIGTSGWQYKHWQGSFYPEKIAQKKWLEYYSKYFETVEVNYSFYRQPKKSIFEKWISETPSHFVFSVKGNRFITHIKRLKDCKDPLRRFFENANILVKKRPRLKHVVLWQLPPNLKKDTDRLKDFLNLLPKDFRHAFEFRHQSWIDKETRSIFEASNQESAVVLQDWKEWPIFTEPISKFVLDRKVASFAYLRFHGKKALYHSKYSNSELEERAKKMQEWKRRGFDIYAYFNNDALGHATENAKKLKELM